MLSPGIEPATFGFPAGHIDHLAIGTAVYRRLKLFQNPVMTNTWQYINIWLCFFFFVFMQRLNVTSNK